jgi:hypothetical protein
MRHISLFAFTFFSFTFHLICFPLPLSFSSIAPVSLLTQMFVQAPPPPPNGKHPSENIRMPSYRRYKVRSVGIATGYGLDGRVSIPGGEKNLFFLLHSVQTCSGVHPG